MPSNLQERLQASLRIVHPISTYQPYHFRLLNPFSSDSMRPHFQAPCAYQVAENPSGRLVNRLSQVMAASPLGQYAL